jgi:hypothetical protein
VRDGMGEWVLSHVQLIDLTLFCSHMEQITQSFEIYIALSPRLPKSAAVGAANAVVKWVKQEEGRLFLKDAPVF